jgi:hypothetical protein
MSLDSAAVTHAFNSMFDPKWDKGIEKAYLNIAYALRDEIRSRLPEGPLKYRYWMTLRNGVVAKSYKFQARHNPSVFVGVDYKLAPHFHLIEFGFMHLGKKGGKGAEPFLVPGKHIFRDTAYKNEEKIVNEMAEVTWRIFEIAWEAE